MWAQTRFIPDVLLVQFRPTAVFTFITDCELVILDWSFIFLFFFLLPLITYLLGLGFLLYLVFWRTVSARVSGVRISSSVFFLLVCCWLLVNLLTVLTWHSPSVFLFQGHLFINDSVLSCCFFFLVLAIIVSFILPLGTNTTPITEPTLLITWVTLFLFFLTCALFTITNLYTLIFFVEFVNLLVFLLLICCQPNSQHRTSSGSTSPLILFFWVNALSSILFFLILLLSSRFGWFSILTQTSSSVFLTIPFFESSWLLFFFFFGLVFIFFFKLGLPPFVFWKLRIFEAAPFWFIAVYNVPYFLFVFLILLNTLPLFSTIPSLNACYSFLPFFIFFVFASLIPLMFLAPNLAYFLTISSGLTVLFLLLFFFTNVALATSLDFTFGVTSSLYLYLLVYTLLILTLITVLNFLTGRLDLTNTPSAGSFSLTTLLFVGTAAQRSSSRTYLLTTLINLAGLPPFLVFLLKLRIIMEFFTSGIGYLPLLLTLVFYLFVSIFFYYRTVRLFFSPTGVIRTTNHKIKPDLTLPHSVNNNLLSFFGAVIFFIFLSICLCPVFVVADLFIYFTGNWPL